MPSISSLLQQGVAHQQSGRWEPAQQCYQQVLALDPCNFNALHLIGVLAGQQGDYARAITQIQAALKQDPASPEAHFNLGRAYKESGQWAAALTSLTQALSLQAHNPQAYCQRGLVHKELAQFEAALTDFTAAIRCQPDDAITHSYQGNALQELKRHADSLLSYDQALTLQPDLLDALINKGLSLLELKRYPEALACYERALAGDPQNALAHFGCGAALMGLASFAQALAQFTRAIALDPSNTESYFRRGNAHRELGHFAESLADFDAVLEHQPDNEKAQFNRGFLFQEYGRINDAIASYQAAAHMAPNYAAAHLGMAFCLLMQGDYRQGWQKYEWRADLLKDEIPLPVARPWLGETSLQDKTILIMGEQGSGDILQFCRYVRALRSAGAKVILLVPTALRRLLKLSFAGDVQLYARDDALPPFDYASYMMSLPLAFHTTVETIPNQVPYLYAHQENCWHWQQKIKALPVFPNPLRIGLVWAGGERPDQPHAQRIDRQRSITFAQLAPILDLQTEFPQLQFFSLQKGAAAQAQLHASPRRAQVIDWMNECQDFADTAALIMNVDLVICVDTSVAHLTGALGKPFWLLNRFNTCWRWLLEREDSPWYPTARIFRQPSLGDWDSVIANVVVALRAQFITT